MSGPLDGVSAAKALRLFEADRDWMAQAACRGMDPELFFPARGELTTPAKQVCRGCAVADACLAYALDTGEHHGIWGGKSERERRTLRRGRSVA